MNLVVVTIRGAGRVATPAFGAGLFDSFVAGVQGVETLKSSWLSPFRLAPGRGRGKWPWVKTPFSKRLTAHARSIAPIRRDDRALPA